jgi:hypothetical protein
MKRGTEPRSLLSVVLLAVAFFLLAPAAGGAATEVVKFTRIAPTLGGPIPEIGMVRTANGALHLVYGTYASSSGVNGLAARSISPGGGVGPQVQALSGWSPTLPGFVELPNGTLEVDFGAISPSNVSSLWDITSSDGGLTWSQPTDVKALSGSLEPFAYASPITAWYSPGADPDHDGDGVVLTVPQAGTLVIHEDVDPFRDGYVYQVSTPAATDGSVIDVGSGFDAATDEVVASWDSLATPGGDFLQAVAPKIGSPQLALGQPRDYLVLAGRDSGPGVFAAYTPDGSHVRLLRYGAGTVAVGSLAGVTAKVLAVATGLGGRIWVMWGDEAGGVAVTRSNRAVTRFEPIQHLNPNAFTLWNLAGDGRLGPLDLLVDETANSKGVIPPPAAFYARVLPELSAKVSAHAAKDKAGKVTAHNLIVKVTDAGDAVAGTTVSAKGHHKKTNAHGVAKLTIVGSAGHVTVTVTDRGYRKLKKKIKLRG